MTPSVSTKGFSLIEVLIATVLVGFAIAALVAANGSFSLANVAGADLSTAEFLIEQIREMTTMLPVVDPAVPAGTQVMVLGPEGDENGVASYDDLDDFDDFDSAALGAPIGAQRTTLPNLAAFRQQVMVRKVNKSDFNQTLLDNDTTTDFVRVEVKILENGRPISSASWIRARY